MDFDLLADLPPPDDSEPPSLRDDIQDELADHLQCAYRREVLKDGDDVAAEQRALDRFGDPKKLARRLWWQAMWSRVMGKRILSGLQWVMTLAALFFAGGVYWQQMSVLSELKQAREEHRQDQLALTTAINRLQPVNLSNYPLNSPTLSQANPPVSYRPVTEMLNGQPVTRLVPVPITPAPGTRAADDFEFPQSEPTPETPGIADDFNGEPDSHEEQNFGDSPGAVAPGLTVKLVQEKVGGPPVTDVLREIVLLAGNNRINGRPESVLTSDTTIFNENPPKSWNGQFIFRSLTPDRYELRITLADGQTSTQPVLIRDEKPQELTVVCPGPRKKVPVLITAPPLPEDLQKAGLKLGVCLMTDPLDLGGTNWDPMPSLMIACVFDPHTGLLAMQQRDGMTADLTKTSEEDRLVFPFAGPIKLYYALGPEELPISVDPFTETRVIGLDTTHWHLELPEELLAKARKQLADEGPVFKKVGEDFDGRMVGVPSAPSTNQKPTDEPPGAKEPGLTVKLVQENEAGPPVTEIHRIELFHGDRVIVGQPVTEAGVKHIGPAGTAMASLVGRYYFETVEPDRYELRIKLIDGQVSSQPLLIRDDKPQELTVVCPGPRKKVPVLITAPPLPEDLRSRGVVLKVGCMPQPIVLGNTTWGQSTFFASTVTFDPESGLPHEISDFEVRVEGNDSPDQKSDVSRMKAEDRVVFLTSGPIMCGIGVVPKEDKAFEIDRMSESEPFIKEIKTDGEPWHLEVPAELFVKARKKLAEVDGSTNAE